MSPAPARREDLGREGGLFSTPRKFFRGPSKDGTSSKFRESLSDDPFHFAADEDDEDDACDALEAADRLERGLSMELVTRYTLPVGAAGRLQRHNVMSSEDKLEWRLFSDAYDFLLYARVQKDRRTIQVFTVDLAEQGEGRPPKPSFSMAWSNSRNEWRLVQEKCDHCQLSPKHLSCKCQGKQQLAYLQHVCEREGDGVSNFMEVTVPGLRGDGTPEVWCVRRGRRDLATYRRKSEGSAQRLCSIEDEAASQGSATDNEALSFVTKRPTWNEEFQCLVLDFSGRTVIPSAGNFQLAPADKPDECVCQFGKIGPNAFGLDFAGPMSLVQAFGVALSTMFLT